MMFLSIQELAGELKDEPGSLLGLRCDVSKEPEIIAMFEQIRNLLGGVDVCFNSAAMAYTDRLLSLNTEHLRHMLDVSCGVQC